MSENKRTLALLSKWFFSMLSHMIQDIPYSEPSTPINKWKRSELEAWLKARRITPRGKKEDLLREVMILKKQRGGPPPIVGPCGGPIILVEQLIGCMLSTVSYSLSRSVTFDIISETRRSIKLFLSSIELLHSSIRDENKKSKDSIVTTRGTLLSLLNIPDNMKNLGPTYLHYEGANRGEGIIKEIKTHIRSTYGNWAVNATTELYKQRSMEYLEGMIQNRMGHEKGKDRCQKRSHYEYKSIQHAIDEYQAGNPLSVIHTKTNEFKIMTASDQALILTPLGITIKKFGCYYHQWANELKQTEVDEHNEICHHTLFLPILTESGIHRYPQSHVYYTISSDWKELNDKLEFITPQCPIVSTET